MSLISYTGTSANATSAAYDLKPIYEKTAKQIANKTIVAYKIVTKNKKKFGGNSLVFAVNPMQGGNYAVVAETSEFAAPSHRDVIQGTVTVRGYQGYTISITKAQMKRSVDPASAFLDTFAAQTDNAMFQLQRHINRQFYGDGTGQLGVVYSSGSNPTDIVLYTTSFPKTTRHLAVNDDVKFLYANGSGFAARATGNSDTPRTYITSISDYKTFSVNDAVTSLTQGDLVVFNYNRTNASDSASADSREMQGLALIAASSGSYKGINPSSAGKGWWKGVAKNFSGVATSLDLSYIYEVAQTMQISTGKNPDTMLSAPEMYYPMFEMMAGNIRYTQAEAGSIGFKMSKVFFPGIGPNGGLEMEVMADLYCPPGLFYIFAASELEMLVQPGFDFEYLDDGADPVQRIPRTQVYEGQLAFAGEPFTRNRGAFGVLDDIDYSIRNSTANF